MVPPDAQAFAASLAMVALYVDAVPGVPSRSVQSVYEPESPSEWTPHAVPQHGVPTHVVRFVSHPLEGSLVQWPKPVLQVSAQLLPHEPFVGLQHVVPQKTDPAFCV